MPISKVILNGATQMDITDTTATAADVAQGKIFYTSDGNRSVGTASGGAVERSDVNFYDYDGTLLHSFTTAEVNESGFALPSNPTHTGLSAQGWNWTLAEIKTQLTAMPTHPVNVGQMYITDDGKTRIYIHMEEGRLNPYLGICPDGDVVVDWGDGSATSTLTGTSLTTLVTESHAYASGGDYIITLTVTSGSFAVSGGTNTTYLLRKGNVTTANVNDVYTNAIRKIEIGDDAIIETYAFQHCYSMKSITIPSSVSRLGTYAFSSCYALESVTIPRGDIGIPRNAFQNCYSLKSIMMPSSVVDIGQYAFYLCQSLRLTIPSNVTSIGQYAFYSCICFENIRIPNGVTVINNYTFRYDYSIASITISSGVTSIGTYAFNGCYGLGEVHFQPTTPPICANSNAWASIPTDCIIYVPTGSLSAYTSAANYPSSSTYTYVEE